MRVRDSLLLSIRVFAIQGWNKKAHDFNGPIYQTVLRSVLQVSSCQVKIALASLLAVDNQLKRFGVKDADMALLDFNNSVFDKF